MKTIKTICLIVLANISFAYAATTIPLNDAKAFKFEQKIGSVFISQPEIADYKVISEHEVIVFSTAIGDTRLMIYNEEGDRILSSLISVNQPLGRVKEKVSQRFPELKVTIESIGDKISVKGLVYTEQERDDIYALVAGLLGKKKISRWSVNDVMEFEDELSSDPKASFYRNYTYEDIIEGLELSFPYQINVKTTIAQVSSEFSDVIGVDWHSITTQTNGMFTLINMSADTLATTINAISDESLGEVLAEPNLTVLSGEDASFLVGGEIPLITVVDDTATYTFKEYGIGLDLSAKVISPEQIRLRVQPSITTIDDIITLNGSRIPQLGSRRVSTTIEIADGQTFMIGGLLSSEDLEEMRKIPFLGDIPFFGSLFSFASSSRSRVELVIIATVTLVKATPPDMLQLPHMEKTNTYDRWLGIDAELDDSLAAQADIKALIEKGGFLK